MRWLIDGLNLIGSRPDGWWRDRGGAIDRLVAQLAEYSREHDERVAVVFDGPPRDCADPGSRVLVVWASGRGPGAADDRIVELVACDTRWRVVTSDRDLGRRVRALGALVDSVSAFRRRLEAGRR